MSASTFLFFVFIYLINISWLRQSQQHAYYHTTTLRFSYSPTTRGGIKSHRISNQEIIIETVVCYALFLLYILLLRESLFLWCSKTLKTRLIQHFYFPRTQLLMNYLRSLSMALCVFCCRFQWLRINSLKGKVFNFNFHSTFSLSCTLLERGWRTVILTENVTTNNDRV